MPWKVCAHVQLLAPRKGKKTNVFAGSFVVADLSLPVVLRGNVEGKSCVNGQLQVRPVEGKVSAWGELEQGGKGRVEDKLVSWTGKRGQFEAFSPAGEGCKK